MANHSKFEWASIALLAFLSLSAISATCPSLYGAAGDSNECHHRHPGS